MIAAARKVFLSYASEQRLLAESVALSLRGRDFEVFLDRDNLGAGGAYDAAIEAAVQSSDAFVFLVSPESVAPGRYTLTELGYARHMWPAAAGRVLPVLAESTAFDTIPAYLKSVTILEPQGSPPAEVGAAVARMLGSVPAATAPFPGAKALSSNADVSRREGVANNDAEGDHWSLIRDSREVGVFVEFLRSYPNGIYSNAAKARIAQLEVSGARRRSTARLMLVGLLTSATLGGSLIILQSDMPLRELVERGIRSVVPPKLVKPPEYRNPDLIQAEGKSEQRQAVATKQPSETTPNLIIERSSSPTPALSETKASPDDVRLAKAVLSDVETIGVKLERITAKLELGIQARKSWENNEKRVQSLMESHEKLVAACVFAEQDLKRREAAGTPEAFLRNGRDHVERCRKAGLEFRAMLDQILSNMHEMKVKVDLIIREIDRLTKEEIALKKGPLAAEVERIAADFGAKLAAAKL